VSSINFNLNKHFNNTAKYRSILALRCIEQRCVIFGYFCYGASPDKLHSQSIHDSTVSITPSPSFSAYSLKHHVIICAVLSPSPHPESTTIMNSCPLCRHPALRDWITDPFPSTAAALSPPASKPCRWSIFTDTTNWIPPSFTAALQTPDRQTANITTAHRDR